ncbi:fumarylacetoacetate hydrolase family protein [Enteractinococcus helveticum]|uniref:Fumarylacetoacetase-like C-terminal domain-containing protein n=1 Tax=Enteractinococcus helveticum TaxID=1837282 RepID=A0A1B7M321_9MICC|nr:fumarylacetoacetate hydrolase family protein [Enteractinococcus helveticum]OAV62970.1 hypothetical protein A6F49_04000 [Enteractinococcus helveticum]
MKLVTYRPHDAEVIDAPLFGAVRDQEIIHFGSTRGHDTEGLDSIKTYLSGLPGTFERAAAIVADPTVSGVPLTGVRLLPVLPEPAAILDSGLSPTHLRASSRTLLRHSLPTLIGRPLGRILGRAASRSTTVRFYKGNHHSISGHGDEIAWPDFTAYLDIEPELALVTGPETQRHTDRVQPAGYLIYNDASARDVQLGEMLFTGPASSKDFDTGNGIGPYLVTPDEVSNPLAIDVQVEFDTRPAWRGSTSDYTHHPEELLAHVLRRRSLPAGTIIGMGTIPGCCGLDRDEWLNPGEAFTIRFEGIGELQQSFGTPTAMPRTNWPRRDSE